MRSPPTPGRTGGRPLAVPPPLPGELPPHPRPGDSGGFAFAAAGKIPEKAGRRGRARRGSGAGAGGPRPTAPAGVGAAAVPGRAAGDGSGAGGPGFEGVGRVRREEP